MVKLYELTITDRRGEMLFYVSIPQEIAYLLAGEPFGARHDLCEKHHVYVVDVSDDREQSPLAVALVDRTEFTNTLTEVLRLMQRLHRFKVDQSPYTEWLADDLEGLARDLRRIEGRQQDEV